MKRLFVPYVFCALFCVCPLIAQDRGIDVIGKRVTGKSDFDIGRQYAVIIGIDKYKEWPGLRGAVSEAKAVRQALGERYYIDQFFELYDADATAVGIRRLFAETLPAKIGVRDSLLVFYAGHGQVDKFKTGFWIASDGSSDQLGQNNWIPNAQLRNMIGNLKAQRILILADSCFSGDFLNVNRGLSTKIDSSYYGQALQLTARQVLTSGASEAVPDESEFGRQLVNILERNTEAVLDPSTMYESIKRGVKQTLPLLGTLPDNQDGATFALFLRSGTMPGSTGSADLLVRAADGAEIFVDGESRGKAPLLLKKLDAGRSLRILVRTESLAGSAEITLAPGELRELSIPLAALTGHLFVGSNESAVRLWLDGVDKGPLGSGIFKGIPIGSHDLELKAPGLYGKTNASVAENATTEVKVTVAPVGSVSFDVPPGASFRLTGQGLDVTRTGAGAIENVPVGEYVLSADGDDYYECKKTVSVMKGDRVSWKPYSGGAIEFAVTPAGATYILDDAAKGSTADMANNVAPGLHNLVVKKPGYKDSAMSVAVRQGRLSRVEGTLERYIPATIRYPDYGIELACEAPEAEPALLGSKDGSATYSIGSRLPVRMVFSSPYAEKLDVSVIETTFSEGETRSFDLPSGRITLPWIPTDGDVKIGSGKTLTLENVGDSGFCSRPLPPGEYAITVSGLVPYVSRVTVRPDAFSEPDDYRGTMSIGLDSKRSELDSNRAKVKKVVKKKKVLGYFCLGTGAAAVGLSVYQYGKGKSAYSDYKDTYNSSDASDYRSEAEGASSGVVIGGVIAGVGLLAASFFFFTVPKTTTLDSQIEELDKQIDLLTTSSAVIK